MPEEVRLFSRHKTRENEDRLFHAGLSHGNSLFGARHAEPVGAKFLEGFGDLRPAVAIAVSLDDAQNFSWRGTLFAFWIYKRADRIEVVFQRAKRHFRPHRPAFKINSRCTFGRHPDSRDFNFTASAHGERL